MLKNYRATIRASFVGYVVDGFTRNGFAGLAVGIALLAACCFFIRSKFEPVEVDAE